MMKRIIALLLALILTVGLLPTVALAADGDETTSTDNSVVIGKIENGSWSKDAPSVTLPTGVEEVSKTAVKKADNTYEVTLKVVLKQTEQSSGKAATVLVLDTSGSMAYCAECGAEPEDDCEHNYVKFDDTPNSSTKYYYKTTDKNGREKFERAYYCDGNHTKPNHNAGWFNSSNNRKHTDGNRLKNNNIYLKTTRTSRLDAAKVAAENFLKTYSGLTFKTDGTPADNQNNRNLGRYVSVVSFASGAALRHNWIDVSNANNYQSVLNKIKTLNPDGGTNLDAGLTYAEYLLKQDTVKNATKNVIALTDGQPTYCLKKNCSNLLHLFNDELTIGNTTYCVHGDGKQCTDEIYNSTVDTATRVKNVPSKIYTVCFDAGETIDVPNSQKKISVSEYLRTKIATQPKAGEKFAYDASNAEQLYAEFAKITQSIVSGLNNGTVKDSLPAGITSTDFGTATQFELNDPAQFHKDVKTETVGEKEVTTYTYTKTYTVTINPDVEGLKTTPIGDDLYAPLNDETTLTVTVDGKEKEIPFPIPAGKVTPKEYTVKGIIDNGGKVNNTDSPYTETVESGKTSKVMTFVPATGYVINTITEKIGTADATNITVSNDNKNSYTYDAKTVTADITVTVTTKKRADLSYTIKYVEEGTTNEIKPADTVGNQEFGAEINVAEMHKPAITGYTYNSCSPIGKLTIGTDENLITLYYTKNKHNITYVYAENSPNTAPSLDLYNETDILYGTPKTRKGAPTLDGWTFNGWTTGDVDVAADGTFTMPDKNVTFTGSWTQRATATISYVVVGPAGCGTVTPASETPYVDADANAVSGSEATATDSYRFVGWYAEEDCTTLLTADSHYTPTKTGDNWTGATYYAKFEAIPTPGADDLPKVDVICTNNVMGHDAKENNALLMDTYTVGKTQYDAASGIYTCEVTLNTPLGYIGNYNVDTPGFTHTDNPANANVTTITLKYENQSWKNETGNFKIYVICDTAKFDVTYTWTGLEDVDFDNDQHKAPTLPGRDTVDKGTTYTVNGDYTSTSTVTDVDGNSYKFSGWSSATEGVTIKNGQIENIQTTVTLTGTWTKLGSGTFDLTNKIFKSFTKADKSNDIPTANGVTYNFSVKVTSQQDSSVYRGGTVELKGATTSETSEVFNFAPNNELTFDKAGTYTYIVEEDSGYVRPNGAVKGKIINDTTMYLLTIEVDKELNVTHYFTALPQTDGAEHMPTITFENKYDEDPNADVVTLDLRKYVTKTFESRHGKSATETFKAKVEIWVDDVQITTNAAEEENSIAVYAAANGEKVYDKTGTVTLSTGETEHFHFDSLATLERGRRYRIIVTETAGSNPDVEYDSRVYDTKFEIDYATKEVEWYEYGGNFSFTNTYTGIDDYYPIIIPAIINKDTGMLNKTDHFAYVIGYPDGTVHPNGQITRAEVATIFFRLLRDEVRDGAFTTSNSYSDVAYGKWYNNPISTMSALGIITGYPDGTFKPNKPITRAEFAAIAARFDETQSGKSATFSDVIGHWAAKEIGIAYYNDWIKGYPDGTFKPDQNITRAEAMTLINRVLERKPESPADLLTNMNKWTDNLDTSKWYYLDVQEATNSHGYTRKTFNYELWRQMLPDPDWSRYER